jgi:hypothetical protein
MPEWISPVKPCFRFTLVVFRARVVLDSYKGDESGQFLALWSSRKLLLN